MPHWAGCCRPRDAVDVNRIGTHALTSLWPKPPRNEKAFNHDCIYCTYARDRAA